MEPNDFDYELIANRAQELAYLVPNLTITLHDERESDTKSDEYHFSNNLADFIAHLNKDKVALHAPIFEQNAWDIQNKERTAYTFRLPSLFNM